MKVFKSASVFVALGATGSDRLATAMRQPVQVSEPASQRMKNLLTPVLETRKNELKKDDQKSMSTRMHLGLPASPNQERAKNAMAKKKELKPATKNTPTYADLVKNRREAKDKEREEYLKKKVSDNEKKAQNALAKKKENTQTRAEDVKNRREALDKKREENLKKKVSAKNAKDIKPATKKQRAGPIFEVSPDSDDEDATTDTSITVKPRRSQAGRRAAKKAKQFLGAGDEHIERAYLQKQRADRFFEESLEDATTETSTSLLGLPEDGSIPEADLVMDNPITELKAELAEANNK